MVKHHFLFVLLCLVIVSTAHSTPLGNGSIDNPYLMSSLDDLVYIANNSNCWYAVNYIVQTCDIDASDSVYLNNGSGFSGIADFPTPFKGTYDGKGYSISNLYMNSTDNYVGLFGYLIGATIKNVHLTNINYSGKNEIGGIVGYCGDSKILNCSTSGLMQTNWTYSFIGGIAGHIYGNSIIEYCYSNVTINAVDYNGGIANTSSGAVIIRNCYFTGNINANHMAGGIVGYSQSDLLLIKNCFVNANISVNDINQSGALVGYNSTPLIQSCFYQDNNGLSPLGQNSLVLNIDPSNTQSLSHSEMCSQDAFLDAGWDFDTIWMLDDDSINNSNPYFFWQEYNQFEDVDILVNNFQDFHSDELNTNIHFLNPFPQNHRLLVNKIELNSVPGTQLPISFQNIGDHYWRINTNYQDTIEYELTLDLQDTASSFSDSQVHVFKREDSSHSWVDVNELGALVTCLDKVITISGLSSFSEFIPVIEDSSLPVELSAFSASIISHNSINLEWVVESETNLIGYYLYTADNNNLEEAQMIPSLVHSINSSQSHKYNFVHKTDSTNQYAYYWLKSLENNGNHNFFGPILVRLDNNETCHPNHNFGNKLFTNYPNPFNPSTNIAYSVASPQNISISIYNSKGQFVKMLYHGFVSQPNIKHNILWNGNDSNNNAVSSGLYLVKMTLQNTTLIQKAILQK